MNDHLRTQESLIQELAALRAENERLKSGRVEAQPEDQKHQAFLLRLSDRLRPVSDPVEIQSIAISMLGAHLDVDNAFYVDISPNGHFSIKREYHRPGAPPRVGAYGMETLKAEILAPLMAGQSLVMQDLRRSPLLTGAERAALTDSDFLSFITVPLNKQGRLISLLSVLSLKPRDWRDGDVSLVEAVAERTWAAVERALAEMAQQESENRIAFQSHLLENVHDAIIATDDQFRLTYWNDRAEQLFGWTAGEALGCTTQELLNPVLSEASRDEAISKLLASGFYAGEVIYHHKDGTPIVVDNRARLIRDAQGHVRETVTSIRDIHAWKEAEAALKASQQHALALVEQLQESDKNKNRFISILSHELRNPLAAIVMGLELLEHEGVREEQKKRAMDILNRQSEHLSSLVDDLLDVTRITENKIKLKLERIELCSFIQQLVLDHQASFETKGVDLQASLLSGPIIVEADALRLNQVVTNLLHNALKFTRRNDSVRVTVSKPEQQVDGAGGGFVCIKVSDTGMGMEPELQKHLFVPFTQADRSLDRTQGGLGLGLSIVKGMVELHGGRVTAESEGIGKGSTFSVTLPAAPPVDRD